MTSMPFTIVLSGASGKMGQAVIAEVQSRRAKGAQIEIVGGLVSDSSASLGKQLTGVTRPLSDQWPDDLGNVHAIIDFSSAEGALLALEHAFQRKIPVVIGTRDLPESYGVIFDRIVKEIAVLRAPNASLTMGALIDTLNERARAIDEGAKIEASSPHALTYTLFRGSDREERFEFQHSSGDGNSYRIAAHGAVEAALWIAAPGRAPGRYAMGDIRKLA